MKTVSLTNSLARSLEKLNISIAVNRLLYNSKSAISFSPLLETSYVTKPHISK